MGLLLKTINHVLEENYDPGELPQAMDLLLSHMTDDQRLEVLDKLRWEV